MTAARPEYTKDDDTRLCAQVQGGDQRLVHFVSSSLIAQSGNSGVGMDRAAISRRFGLCGPESCETDLKSQISPPTQS